jgi:hypothetical protein
VLKGAILFVKWFDKRWSTRLKRTIEANSFSQRLARQPALNITGFSTQDMP